MFDALFCSIVFFPAPHADTRTLDPDEANLFYVPALTFSFTGNGERPHSSVRRVARPSARSVFGILAHDAAPPGAALRIRGF